MLPENRAFWVRGEDGEDYGPVDRDELRDWVRENRAGLGTEVRLDEPAAEWSPWQSFPDLVALLAEVQATSALPDAPGMRIAPLGRRIGAGAMDLLLSFILIFPILFALALIYLPDFCVQSALASADPRFAQPELSAAQRAVGSLIADTMLALYMAGFHAAHGRTPAKSLLRLKVVDQMGQKPSFAKSLLRALVFVLSLGLSGIPLLYAFFNPERRAFHDLVAGTYVVEE